MAPKFDPNEIKIIYVRQYGGEVGASSVLAPKVGPIGMSPKKIGEDIQKASQDWKGIKITAQLAVQNRKATVTIKPTATSLLIKELKEPLRDRKKTKDIKHNGNLTMEQVLGVAKKMRPTSMAKEFKGTVKEILGTCRAIGCSVAGRSPQEWQADIDTGDFVPEEPSD
ncbi:60S ribosomal protein L12, putative [Perkinsus marinus ATCC 50983]|uniref:60S ribosomal protein L12, putative n=1 Tax=Perkinsus marinus (strain ATCC 50983 / TXsc) TaxID=423536 RepID=C5KTQ1_PERM5|nr:60S ribosomal protein L12, putative [Perkinsus marinus ATCC 50983]XP_002780148.1 60S ribosomal protein L12, putative [Perkinsus marinus ATCC 50983]EER05696.1 60S ribosomal protein L12, putative [Perkinsus marinus ATCC 50983]EER11943.1 60S ribosomal protein L12, putative [Perkinsus marinus ATCC 50983]|eukprot:XP_002773880.1 60S ribosomal protein L12, putative [Perkinsus marinus ATCC 50983]